MKETTYIISVPAQEESPITQIHNFLEEDAGIGSWVVFGGLMIGIVALFIWAEW